MLTTGPITRANRCPSIPAAARPVQGGGGKHRGQGDDLVDRIALQEAVEGERLADHELSGRGRRRIRHDRVDVRRSFRTAAEVQRAHAKNGGLGA